jgi:uncharacterized protein (DUF2132 family)
MRKAGCAARNAAAVLANYTRNFKGDPMGEQHPTDILHGITLKMIVTELVEEYGWQEMGRRIEIRCFIHEPSISSSLKYLRRTPWARDKVEELYLRWKVRSFR